MTGAKRDSTTEISPGQLLIKGESQTKKLLYYCTDTGFPTMEATAYSFLHFLDISTWILRCGDAHWYEMV